MLGHDGAKKRASETQANEPRRTASLDRRVAWIRIEQREPDPFNKPTTTGGIQSVRTLGVELVIFPTSHRSRHHEQLQMLIPEHVPCTLRAMSIDPPSVKPPTRASSSVTIVCPPRDQLRRQTRAPTRIDWRISDRASKPAHKLRPLTEEGLKDSLASLSKSFRISFSISSNPGL